MDATPIITFGGSGLCGYFMGFALRKIVKWVVIGLGVLAGVVFIAIQWLSNNGYIQSVKWDKLGEDISQAGQQLYTQLDFNNLHGVFHALGIPVTGGLAIGMLAGFVKTH